MSQTGLKCPARSGKVEPALKRISRAASMGHAFLEGDVPMLCLTKLRFIPYLRQCRAEKEIPFETAVKFQIINGLPCFGDEAWQTME